MLLERCVCIRQAGHRLWPVCSSPFILPVNVYLQSFMPDDFSNLKLSSPHQRVQLCQMRRAPANRTKATAATSYQQALPSSMNSLVILGLSPFPSPLQRLLQGCCHLYGCQSLQEDAAMLSLVWKSSEGGTVPGPNILRPVLKIPSWLSASSAESFCLLRLF